jgi:preprotein translocase subunit SecA
MRDSIMSGEASFDVLKEMMEDAISAFAYKHLGEHQGYPSEDDLRALEKALFQEFKCLVLLVDVALEEQYLTEHVVQLCVEKVMEKYATLRKGDEDLTQVEKEALLSALDGLWPLHLQELEEAREGIHLRSIAQQNPVYAFAREGKTLFAAYRQGVCEHVTRLLLNPQAVVASAMPAQRPAPAPAAPAPSLTPVSVPPVTLSRNAPCSCGSGLRFKECHGKLKAA